MRRPRPFTRSGKGQGPCRDDVAIMGVGSLGINGVQIAKAAGCRVIAIDILPSKLEFARTYGADETIDGRKEDIAVKVRAFTGGKGVDAFIDFVGNPDSVRAGLHSLRRAGKLVVVGHDPYHPLQVKAFQNSSWRKQRSSALTHQRGRSCVTSLILVQTGKLKPVIGARYPLAQANEAHQALRKGISSGGSCCYRSGSKPSHSFPRRFSRRHPGPGSRPGCPVHDDTSCCRGDDRLNSPRIDVGEVTLDIRIFTPLIVSRMAWHRT